MKIVISDYPDVLGRELEKEIAFVREDIPDAVVVVHPYVDPEDFYRELTDPDTLLAASDAVSNHMNLTPENAHYFDLACFRKMKKHPILICTPFPGCPGKGVHIKSIWVRIFSLELFIRRAALPARSGCCRRRAARPGRFQGG